MPIYEYECLSNKHRFEVIQKFSDPPVLHCTVCGDPVQKLLSSAAIQFKGTGWYITDYARKGSSPPPSSSSSPSSSPPSSDSGSSDQKSASASDTTSGSKKSDGSKKSE